MKIKHLKKIGSLVVLIILLYSLMTGIHLFYTGYHNLDTAQNFIQLGYSQDINLGGELIDLKNYYLLGLNQMLNGFGWVCFDVILSLMFGYLFKGGLKDDY